MCKLTFGTDPEFELVTRLGEVVSCARVDRDLYVHSPRVGVDGAGNQLELRPAPQDNARAFVLGLSDTFRVASQVIGREFELSAIGNIFPLGAHLHVGHSCGDDGCKLSRQVGAEIEGQFRARLDWLLKPYLGYFNGSARGEYRNDGIRVQSWGLEYRPLPSLIFAGREVAYHAIKGFIRISKAFFMQEFPRLPVSPDARAVRGGMASSPAMLEKTGLTCILEAVSAARKVRGNQVLANWGIRRPREVAPNEVDLRVTNAWHSDVRDRAVEMLRGDERYQGMRIRLFGVARSGGEEWTFSSRTLNSVDFGGLLGGFAVSEHRFSSVIDSERRLSIGIPYGFRFPIAPESQNMGVCRDSAESIVAVVRKVVEFYQAAAASEVADSEFVSRFIVQ